MPANFDLFSTATMLKAVEQMPRVYTFLSDTFCGDGEVIEDDTAMYDYRKGAQTGMAPFVVPGTGGVLMNDEGFEMRKIAFSTLAPELEVTQNDISHRMFGESVMGAMTPEQRSKRLLAKHLTRLRAMVQNRRNWMAREVLLKGKMEILRYTNEGREKNASMLADFQFSNYYTPVNKWNAAGAKIDYDMRKAYDLVYEGLGEVDTIVMASDVRDAILENSTFMKNLDMKNVNMGEINTRYHGQGVRFLGYNSDNVAMWDFTGKFLNDKRQMEDFLPSGTVLLGSSANKPLRCVHGPVTITRGLDETAEHKTYINKEVPTRHGGSNTDSITTRLTSRPTIVPENVGAWCVMKVF